MHVTKGADSGSDALVATTRVTDTPTVTRASIEATYQRIAPYLRETPILRLDAADFGVASFPLVLKLEMTQHAGSFKSRGAFANLLLRDVPEAGVAAASGGNHGAAVAYAAKELGHRARIFVPSISSPAKIAKIRSYGADLVIAGDRYADALAASEAYVRESGALPVHAFDQTETLLGQGTLGMELEEQLPGIDTLLVAVGGGGLVGGIVAWFAPRLAAGTIRVIGVEPEEAPTLTQALQAGGPVDAPAGGIAADSLAPQRIGSLVFPIVQASISGVVLVPDTAIRKAQEMLWNVLRVAAEPGGAAATAALLSRRYVPSAGERVAVLVSGGNTTAVNFSA